MIRSDDLVSRGRTTEHFTTESNQVHTENITNSSVYKDTKVEKSHIQVPIYFSNSISSKKFYFVTLRHHAVISEVLAQFFDNNDTHLSL